MFGIYIYIYIYIYEIRIGKSHCSSHFMWNAINYALIVNFAKHLTTTILCPTAVYSFASAIYRQICYVANYSIKLIWDNITMKLQCRGNKNEDQNQIILIKINYTHTLHLLFSLLTMWKTCIDIHTIKNWHNWMLLDATTVQSFISILLTLL